MAKFIVEFPDDSPFFTRTNEFDGTPEPITIVAFTRGDQVGTDLITGLQECVDDSPSHISGDFQMGTIIEEIS